MFVTTFVNGKHCGTIGLGVFRSAGMVAPLHARQPHPCWVAGSIGPPKPLNSK